MEGDGRLSDPHDFADLLRSSAGGNLLETLDFLWREVACFYWLDYVFRDLQRGEVRTTGDNANRSQQGLLALLVIRDALISHKAEHAFCAVGIVQRHAHAMRETKRPCLFPKRRSAMRFEKSVIPHKRVGAHLAVHNRGVGPDVAALGIFALPCFGVRTDQIVLNSAIGGDHLYAAHEGVEPALFGSAFQSRMQFF